MTIKLYHLRLERATYCLGGIPETRPDVAGHGLTCRSAEVIMAGRGLARLGACGRWLPDWLPGVSLATLMFDCTETSDCCRDRANVPGARSEWRHGTGLQAAGRADA
jgi:hypothetical protein